MKQISLPIFLLVSLIGLSQLSETIYTVGLPIIQKFLATSPHMMEWTLTIYLAGFALGSIFWGIASDKFGRRPSMIMGICVYIVGCIICAVSKEINVFMVGRLIQAFGGSVGAVLSQSMVRDVYSGKELAKMYGTMAISLAIFPAVGPLIGGFIMKYCQWPTIFFTLSGIALLLFLLVIWLLPETNKKENRKFINPLIVAKRIYSDYNVICIFIINGLVQGIVFSYYAEAPFYTQNLLKISPSNYGFTITFMMIGFAVGGIISRKLSSKFDSNTILRNAIVLELITTFVFVVVISILNYIVVEKYLILIFLLLFMTIISCVGPIIVSQCLALALKDYKDVVGTAGAIFNFSYFAIIAICTFVMGFIHNNSLITMPGYFFILCVLMFGVLKYYDNKTLSLMKKTI